MVKRVEGMYSIARVKVVYRVGMPNRVLLLTLAIPTTTPRWSLISKLCRPRVFQFGKFFVFYHDKSIIGKNIVNFPGDQLGRPDQAGVVQSENGCRLINAVMELDEGYPGI